MGSGRWSFEKDAEGKCFLIYRNRTLFAVASYDDNALDGTEAEVWEGVREMMDCIEFGRPYVDAMNPMLKGFDESAE
jgi:hypothetical protein